MQSQFSVFPGNVGEAKTGKTKLKSRYIGDYKHYIQMHAHTCANSRPLPLRVWLSPFSKAWAPTALGVQRQITKRTAHWLFGELTRI